MGSTAVSSFLTSRNDKYKPNDKAISGLKRLNKIDFDGNIHLSDKPTKTDMIIIRPGDLVISGINVAKGAVAVYQGKEPITATIHYSSYIFNEKKINIEFFKRFLKSSAFIDVLKTQVKSGIKTEIKAKQMLVLKIDIPDIEEQKKTNKHFESFEEEFKTLDFEMDNQENIIGKLRQAILQEAIEGKLTADWHKDNPVRKGDPDYDAEALLEKIREEKKELVKAGKLKKLISFPYIIQDEMPSSLPKGWIWCKLGDIGVFGRGKSKHRPRNDSILFKDGTIPFVQTGEVAQSYRTNDYIDKADRFYNEVGLKQSKLWPAGTLCITIAANIAETGVLSIEACFPDSVVGFTSLTGENLSWIIKYFLYCVQDDIIKFAPATA